MLRMAMLQPRRCRGSNTVQECGIRFVSADELRPARSIETGPFVGTNGKILDSGTMPPSWFDQH